MAAGPKGRKVHRRIDLKLSPAWVSMADQLALLTDQSRNQYIKNALIRQMQEDWLLMPGRGFWLSPRATVFRVEDGVFRPVAAALGGERCWIKRQVGRLPKALGGEPGYEVDIVPVAADGLRLDSGVVGQSSFGGPVG